RCVSLLSVLTIAVVSVLTVISADSPARLMAATSSIFGRGSGLVTVLSGPTVHHPATLVVDEASHHVFALNAPSYIDNNGQQPRVPSSVSALDATTGRVIRTVRINQSGVGPLTIAVAHRARHLFVVNRLGTLPYTTSVFGPVTGTVTMLDTATGRL